MRQSLFGSGVLDFCAPGSAPFCSCFCVWRAVDFLHLHIPRCEFLLRKSSAIQRCCCLLVRCGSSNVLWRSRCARAACPADSCRSRRCCSRPLDSRSARVVVMRPLNLVWLRRSLHFSRLHALLPDALSTRRAPASAVATLVRMAVTVFDRWRSYA